MQDAMQDPFFRRDKLPWGQQRGYVEDIHRTYKPGSLPKRDEEGFARALDFRKKEKQAFASMQAQLEAVTAERNSLHSHSAETTQVLADSVKYIQTLEDLLDRASKLYSNAQKDNERSTAGGGDRVGSDSGDGDSEPPRRNTATSNAGQPTEQQHAVSDHVDDDSGGQASEHNSA